MKNSPMDKRRPAAPVVPGAVGPDRHYVGEHPVLETPVGDGVIRRILS